MITVSQTKLAEAQRSSLRATPKKKFEEWLVQFKKKGCSALHYRLSGDVLERLCVSHIHGRWRSVVAFETPKAAVLILIGEHRNDDPGLDVYTQLYQLANVKVPSAPRKKPQCCEDGQDPPLWKNEIDDFSRRAIAVARFRKGTR